MATTFLLPIYNRNLPTKTQLVEKLILLRREEKIIVWLKYYSSYDSRTSSANRNMLLQGTESKHRQVAFCLQYTVLIYFCFPEACVLLAAKEKHTHGLNSYSNCALSLLFFRSLHSALSHFWWKTPFSGDIKTMNYEGETALKYQRI